MREGIRYSRSVAETKHIARDIISRAAAEHSSPNALVISIFGELGAGKTSFVKGGAAFFGIPQKNITSPTFALLKRHLIKRRGTGFRFFYHADAYRIDNAREFASLGFGDITKDSESIVCVEWGERIRSLLPRNTLRISIGPGKKKNERAISINRR